MTLEQALLLELPERIETERLVLRPPRVGEGAAINAAIIESLAELRPWMPWAREAPGVEDTEANTRRAIAKTLAREDIRIHLHLKSDGTFVGGSGLHRIDWSVPKFEIGYWCRTSLAGRGYVTEATVAIARFALERLGALRVEIRCDERNARSRRVAERAGFTQEGILRNDCREDGRVRNTAVYSLVPKAISDADRTG
jgi:RimJ/RimL family protein N-acetyltransferase